MFASAWFAALVAGGVAQTIKLTLAIRRARELSAHAFLNLPGMPSTWAAMCGALCLVLGRRQGLASPEFAMTVALSCLVLYDTLGLRRSAGRQARLLNTIARELEARQKQAAGRHLRELLGESPAQVAGGLAVGLVVALPWVV